MTIGLIDVDGHKFPNMALMRISKYYKQNGDTVEWYREDGEYDIVYKSKIFSDSYTKDVLDPENTNKLIKGGTGYAIKLEDGLEVFHSELHENLPDEIEHCRPDYSLYPQFDFAVTMTTRGCPRGCKFCHVVAKEGRGSVKVADVSDFYEGQKQIYVLDPNITACKDKHELFQQYIDTKAIIDFTQGLDIRLLTEEDIDYINQMRLRTIHFAWDDANEDLVGKFQLFADKFRRKSNIGMVYILTNFGSTMEENLYRIYTLRDMGYDPYVTIYDKPHAPKEIRRLQRWVNNKIVFKKCKDFNDYDTSK